MKILPVGMIFAAGFGTRLKPLSDMRPKPLMEIGGSPIICHLIKMLEKADIRDIYINLHYGAEQIRDHLEKIPQTCKLHFSFEEEILGTGGGVSQVINKYDINAPMVIIHGDIMCDIDLREYLQNIEYCTLLCAREREVLGYVGSVGVDAENNIVELGRFFTKPGPIAERGFFSGVQILSKEAVGELRSQHAFSLVGDIYPIWLNHRKIIKARMFDQNYEDLGTAERIFNANMAILQKPSSFRHMDFVQKNSRLFLGDIYINQESSIAEDVQIIGPVRILQGAVIEKGASIGPRVILGENSRVNTRANLKNTVVMRDTVIEKDEHLDCMIALLRARVLVDAVGG